VRKISQKQLQEMRQLTCLLQWPKARRASGRSGLDASPQQPPLQWLLRSSHPCRQRPLQQVVGQLRMMQPPLHIAVRPNIAREWGRMLRMVLQVQQEI
jgi:hypothetical protein